MSSFFRFRDRQPADDAIAPTAPQSSENLADDDAGLEQTDAASAPAEPEEPDATSPPEGPPPETGAMDAAPLEDDDQLPQAPRPAEPDHDDGQPVEAEVKPPALAARRTKRPRQQRALAAAGVKPKQGTFTAEQRLLLLDTWQRSGLPAGDFAPLVGVAQHTLYAWKRRFAEQGPAGLADQPRGTRKGSRLPEVTKRAILMLKQEHPEWGCERISDMLVRGPALPASATAVAKVLKEAGYEATPQTTRPHPDKVRRFERARANQLWQTDLFTFVLKRQNRRLHLVAFLDDHSRFVVSYGLHATASTALVLEALEAGIASYGPPDEILTDNGPQYVTWRGKSQFSKQLEKRGIRQIVARPRRPQTLGKIERFWGTLWRECLETAVFVDLADARTRIGLFVDHYNFQRVHRGIDGLVPADRFFGAAPDVLRTLQERVEANALELARHGAPKQPFYVTGRVEGQAFSVHSEGERLILRREDGGREEVTLGAAPHEEEEADAPLPLPVCPQAAPPDADGEPATLPPPAPGSSALDDSPAASPTADDPDTEEGGVV